MILRIPIGMTDLVILLGTRAQQDRATRRILSQQQQQQEGGQ